MSVTAFNRHRRELAKEAEKKEKEKQEELKEPTVAELKEEATALGVEFKSNIKKADLIALIEAKKAEQEKQE